MSELPGQVPLIGGSAEVPLLAAPRHRPHWLRYAALLMLACCVVYAGFFALRLDRRFPGAAWLQWLPVAYASGHPITLAQLNRSTQELTHFYQQRTGDRSPGPSFEQQALRRLLENLLIDRELASRRLMVPPAMVQQQLNLFVQNFTSSAELTQFLGSSYGWSEADFKTELLLPYLKRSVLEEQLGQDPAAQDAALAMAQDLRSHIMSGQVTFAAAAERWSDDQATATSDGDLGWFDRQAVPLELSSGLMNVRVGEVSEPIKTKAGYELVTILQAVPGAASAVESLHLAHILVKSVSIDRWLDVQLKRLWVVRLLPF